VEALAKALRNVLRSTKRNSKAKYVIVAAANAMMTIQEDLKQHSKPTEKSASC
jgi:hypothetical protein